MPLLFHFLPIVTTLNVFLFSSLLACGSCVLPDMTLPSPLPITQFRPLSALQLKCIPFLILNVLFHMPSTINHFLWRLFLYVVVIFFRNMTLPSKISFIFQHSLKFQSIVDLFFCSFKSIEIVFFELTDFVLLNVLHLLPVITIFILFFCLLSRFSSPLDQAKMALIHSATPA